MKKCLSPGQYGWERGRTCRVGVASRFILDPSFVDRDGVVSGGWSFCYIGLESEERQRCPCQAPARGPPDIRQKTCNIRLLESRASSSSQATCCSGRLGGSPNLERGIWRAGFCGLCLRRRVARYTARHRTSRMSGGDVSGPNAKSEESSRNRASRTPPIAMIWKPRALGYRER